MTSAITPDDTRTRRKPLAAWHVIALPLALAAAGCDLPGKPNPDHRPLFPNQVSTFSSKSHERPGLFEKNCQGCHGPDGKMGPAPPLNDPLFRAGITTEELTAILTAGRKGMQMPGFLKKNGGSLTAEQIQILVHEIKGLPYSVVETGDPEHAKLVVTADEKGRKPAWGTPPAFPANAPTYQPQKTESSPDEKRGEKVFARACASCHGDNGKKREKDPKIGPINNQAFLALMSDQALRRLIITGRPDLGMPNYAENIGRAKDFAPLSAQEVADLVALLGHWRKGGGK